MDWVRYSNPSTVCDFGPDIIMQAPADQIAETSWETARSPNPASVVLPERQSEWESFYVRTAIVRANKWKEGARGPVVKTPEKALEILQHLGYLDHERVVTLALDEKWKLLAIHEASVGGLHGCAIMPREVLRVPVLVGAKRFLMAHNHPSGDATPSQEDLEMTKALSLASREIGIQLIDHLTVVRGREYRSISEFSEQVGFDVGAPMSRLKAPGADVVFKADLDTAQLAARPYGKYDRFLVRTAMIEAQGRKSQGPIISSFESAVTIPAVQALRQFTSQATVILCLDGAARLIALNVKTEKPHELGVAAIFGVAATVPTSSMIIAHNHPRGDATPMKEERFLQVLNSGLRWIGTGLVDSIIVEPHRVFSARD